MKIAVVIVTYNPKKWLRKCLSSLEQSTVDLNIIVVDNKSTDGSNIIIKNHFPNVTLLEVNENQGFGKGNNIGIKKALSIGADYVFLLNQDAWIESNTIINLISAHQKEPQYGVISPMHLNGTGDALDYKFSFYISPSKCKNLYSDIYLKNIKSHIYEVDFVNAAAWLISRECIEKVGGFNPSFFHYGEDDNYIERIKFHSFKLGVLPDSIIFHDRQSTSKDNVYFQDDKILYERSVILKFSNPYNNCSFQDEYKKNYMALLKAIVFLKIGDVKKNILKIKILNHLDKKNILKNNYESKKMVKSFLNYDD